MAAAAASAAASSSSSSALGWASLASNVAGSAGNWITGGYERKKWQEYNNALIQLNYDLLQEQRRYDSPSALRQRYEAAGLNPIMMLDSFNSSQQPIQASTGSPSSPMSIPVDFAGLSSSILNAMKINLEEKRVANETQKTNQDIAESAAREANIKFSTQLQQDMRSDTIDNLKKQNQELASKIALNKATDEYFQAQKAYSAGLLKTENLLRNKKYENLVQDTFLKASGIKLNNQEVKNLQMAEIGLYLDNKHKVNILRFDGLEYKIRLIEGGLLAVDYEVHDSAEWKEAAKRHGLSDDELTQRYTNGIVSTIGQMLFTGALLYGARRGGGTNTPQRGLYYPENYKSGNSFFKGDPSLYQSKPLEGYPPFIKF